MSKVFIEDIQVRDKVNTSFLVKHIALMEARNGSQYLNLIVSDKTGDLESRIWSDAKVIAEQVHRGDIVEVEGKLNLYQGKKQLVITQIKKMAEADILREDYIVASSQNIDKMYAELIAVAQNLKDVYIRDLLLCILKDEDISRRLKLWPAGKSIHHAYQGGLLEHILSCTQLSQYLSSHYQVNENYVVAGAILHDLCKIYELSEGLATEYTDEGKLVGHLVKGTELVERFSRKIKGFPKDLKMHLQHILLSHHGHMEYGSPKLPQTMEAYLVHLIDYMDSKINALKTVCEQDQSFGNWTGFIKHLDRVVYKKPLPYYEGYREAPAKAEKKGSAQPKPTKELRQNLGKFLEGFEIEK